MRNKAESTFIGEGENTKLGNQIKGVVFLRIKEYR